MPLQCSCSTLGVPALVAARSWVQLQGQNNISHTWCLCGKLSYEIRCYELYIKGVIRLTELFLCVCKARYLSNNSWVLSCSKGAPHSLLVRLWFHLRVDLFGLATSHCTRCLLGQLHGGLLPAPSKHFLMDFISAKGDDKENSASPGETLAFTFLPGFPLWSPWRPWTHGCDGPGLMGSHAPSLPS